MTVRNSESLSPRQLVALPYVASEATVSEGARAAGIARMTLTRWQRDPAFREELERMRRNISELAYSNLEGLTLKSVIRLQQLLDDPDPNVRHRAIKTALSLSLSIRDNRELRRQMETLERALTLIRQQR
ncbi:MAG: hypothetical protein OXE02_13035 [Chloroflexi bacterium]|nr:hypothetical protein [Chloroflexota bacterium]